MSRLSLSILLFGSILVGLQYPSLLIPFDLFDLKNRAYVYLTNCELSYFSISFTVLLFSGFAFFLNQAFKRIADQLADYHRLSFCFFILVVFYFLALCFIHARIILYASFALCIMAPFVLSCISRYGECVCQGGMLALIFVPIMDEAIFSLIRQKY